MATETAAQPPILLVQPLLKPPFSFPPPPPRKHSPVHVLSHCAERRTRGMLQNVKGAFGAPFLSVAYDSAAQTYRIATTGSHGREVVFYEEARLADLGDGALKVKGTVAFEDLRNGCTGWMPSRDGRCVVLFGDQTSPEAPFNGTAHAVRYDGAAKAGAPALTATAHTGSQAFIDSGCFWGDDAARAFLGVTGGRAVLVALDEAAGAVLQEFAGDGPVLLPRCSRDNSHVVLLSRGTGALTVLRPDAAGRFAEARRLPPWADAIAAEHGAIEDASALAPTGHLGIAFSASGKAVKSRLVVVRLHEPLTPDARVEVCYVKTSPHKVERHFADVGDGDVGVWQCAPDRLLLFDVGTGAALREVGAAGPLLASPVVANDAVFYVERVGRKYRLRHQPLRDSGGATRSSDRDSAPSNPKRQKTRK